MTRYRSRRETERLQHVLYESLRARLLAESIQGATLEQLLKTVDDFSAGEMPYDQYRNRKAVSLQMREWLTRTARSQHTETERPHGS